MSEQEKLYKIMKKLVRGARSGTSTDISPKEAALLIKLLAPEEDKK